MQSYSIVAKKCRLRLQSVLNLKLQLLTLFFALLVFADPGFGAEISAVNVKLLDNNIYVTTSVKPDSKFIDDIAGGLSKEIIFYIDLFRVWRIWPNEFVTGKKLIKNLKSDPIKRQYIAIRIEGHIYLERKFNDLASMVDWTMNIADIKLTNIRELEPGIYFVKVIVESRIRRLPPVIGHLLFFVPENEFSISNNSSTFQISIKK